MRGEVLELMKRVIEEYYDDFMQKRWGLIAERMNISEEQMADVCREILKLNPKPGASMGETMNRSIDEITPDFIVDTLDLFRNLNKIRKNPKISDFLLCERGDTK